MRLFLPLLLVLAAIGLFVLYTNPTYQATKGLSAQVLAYNNALDKSQQLKGIRDQLLSKRNTFSADDVQKLQEILPDNVDNIRFLIDINNIAARHNLSLKSLQLGSIGNASGQPAVTIGAANGAVGSVDIGFTINASYDDIMAFLQDIEHSLRLTDVEKFTFTSAAGATDYTFSVRTYWLTSQASPVSQSL